MRQQPGLPGGCAELPGQRGSPLPASKGQQGPGLFTLDFLFVPMHKAQCGVRACPWKETEEASKLFSMVNIYTNIIYTNIILKV